MKNSISVYRTPLIEVSSKCVFTNTTPVGAYRGAGRPEGNYYMERLIDTAAREMGIDRVELRRRNHIAPEAMPYDAPSGIAIRQRRVRGDSRPGARRSRIGTVSRRARPRAARRGKLRGRGIGQYLEVTAPPTNEMGGIRFEPDGTVTIITGTLDYGQGHASPFAQVLRRAARHPVRAHPPAAGRQRRAHRGRRHRRLEIDHGERRRDLAKRATR